MTSSQAVVAHVPELVGIVRECLGFVRRHLILVPLLLVVTLPATAIHEGAHALAAMAQGARLTKFEVGPWMSGGQYWGSMNYAIPAGVSVCSPCVSLAPYVTWALLALVAAVIAWRLRIRTRERSALFVMGFALPHLDLLQHVAGWLEGSTRNDLAHALGPPDWPALAVFATYGLIVLGVGFAVQRRLYGERSLSTGAFLLLAGMTAATAPLASNALQALLS